MKGLIIKSPWIDYILSGDKKWEIRGSSTNIRGDIALIKSGTGHVFGKASLTDCFEISPELYRKSSDKHMIPEDSLNNMPYKRIFVWVLENAVRYEKPVSYIHPKGAIIWVNIQDA